MPKFPWKKIIKRELIKISPNNLKKIEIASLVVAMISYTKKFEAVEFMQNLY